jgi:hypothetical protein
VTEVSVRGRVGPDQLADGAEAKLRQGKSAEQIIQQLHGRLYETNYRGALYSGGMGLTAINNATFTTGTLTASCTPVAGVWNPPGSGVNLAILQAILGLTMTALQATGGAPFVWASSVANTGITTGNEPLNRSTLQLGGSKARDMSNVALTGLTNNLVVRHASLLGGGSATSAAFLATAVALQTQQQSFAEPIDGAILVPPGGVLALLATTTPVAHSAASMLLWEEVPT